jgi:hypothetical protein
VLSEVHAAALAGSVPAKLQSRLTHRLEITSIRLAGPEIPRLRRRFVVLTAIGLTILFNISALICPDQWDTQCPPPPRRLTAHAISTSAPTIQTDSGYFGKNTGRIVTNSENSLLTGTIQ